MIFLAAACQVGSCLCLRPLTRVRVRSFSLFLFPYLPYKSSTDSAGEQGLHVQSNSFARYGMKQHQRQLLKQNTQTQTIFAQHRPGTLRLRGGEEPGEAEVVPVDWQAVIGSLLGGLSLFLYSMKKLGDGIRGACGPQLKDMLRLLSDNRFMGFLTGMFVCALTNSLSLIAVLLVGFVGADLVKMENCLSILLGACVGSTFISYLVVFKVTQYGLLFIFGGYCITFFSSALRTQKIGDSIFGLGLIFYSMELMSSAFSFVKEHDGFLYILSRSAPAPLPRSSPPPSSREFVFLSFYTPRPQI